MTCKSWPKSIWSFESFVPALFTTMNHFCSCFGSARDRPSFHIRQKRFESFFFPETTKQRYNWNTIKIRQRKNLLIQSYTEIDGSCSGVNLCTTRSNSSMEIRAKSTMELKMFLRLRATWMAKYVKFRSVSIVSHQQVQKQGTQQHLVSYKKSKHSWAVLASPRTTPWRRSRPIWRAFR